MIRPLNIPCIAEQGPLACHQMNVPCAGCHARPSGNLWWANLRSQKHRCVDGRMWFARTTLHITDDTGCAAKQDTIFQSGHTFYDPWLAPKAAADTWLTSEETPRLHQCVWARSCWLFLYVLMSLSTNALRHVCSNTWLARPAQHPLNISRWVHKCLHTDDTWAPWHKEPLSAWSSFWNIKTLKCITKECLEGEGMVHERILSRVARADD